MKKIYLFLNASGENVTISIQEFGEGIDLGSVYKLVFFYINIWLQSFLVILCSCSCSYNNDIFSS